MKSKKLKIILTEINISADHIPSSVYIKIYKLIKKLIYDKFEALSYKEKTNIVNGFASMNSIENDAAKEIVKILMADGVFFEEHKFWLAFRNLKFSYSFLCGEWLINTETNW
jgi:hypothetical protein